MCFYRNIKLEWIANSKQSLVASPEVNSEDRERIWVGYHQRSWACWIMSIPVSKDNFLFRWCFLVYERICYVILRNDAISISHDTNPPSNRETEQNFKDKRTFRNSGRVLISGNENKGANRHVRTIVKQICFIVVAKPLFFFGSISISFTRLPTGNLVLQGN